MITLERASKDGDTYTATAPDYITNNEQKTKSNIALETYATDLKQTQVRLTYNDGVADKEPKVLKPKQILFERPHFQTKTHRRNIMSMDMVIYRAYIQRPETRSRKQMITMVW